MNSKIPGQLLSSKITSFEDKSAGHTNETAIHETFLDNPRDVGAKKFQLFTSYENKCWATLNDGDGIKNIANILGCGHGIRIKGDGKIGNKIQGEFASIYFFKPHRIIYYSRCPENDSGPIHQQLIINVNDTIKVVKTPGIDLTLADKIIYEGIDGNTRKKLIKIPEPAKDKFDTDDVEEVLRLFKNNEVIKNFFETNVQGMLKVYIYDEETKEKFENFMSEIPKILEKIEFLTYNTVQFFRCSCELNYYDVDKNQVIKTINESSCKKNLIIGTNSIYDDEEETEDEEQDVYDINSFGLVSLNKVLIIHNTIYFVNGKYITRTTILNFNQTFIIKTDGKREAINSKTDPILLNQLCDQNIFGKMVFSLSFITETETEEQLTKMNLTKAEDLKKAYVYFNNRVLDNDKIPSCPQERSLPNLRMCVFLDSNTTKFIKIKGLKSSIDLAHSEPIILKIFDEIIKPLLSAFSSQKNVIHFANGIDNWNKYKNNVYNALSIPVPSNLVTTPTASPIPNQVTHPVATLNTTVVPIIPPPIVRSETTVLSSLTKIQAIAQLKRLKVKTLNTHNYRTKKDRAKLYTVLNNIEKEIVIDEELLTEKIDNLIALLEDSLLGMNDKVKNAAQLQEL